ncbi:MAG: hypothetical protein BRC28_03165 [Nanohaloarchaea archaeon SW_4_43_9]|nr:MAG: hypothetical protein BRC28_03165 [Nanohaloarchaea archaeon SW_4_43_9]
MVIGTRVSDNSIRLINLSSKSVISKIQLSNYVDNTGLYHGNSSYIAGSSLNALVIHNVETENSFRLNTGGYSRSVPNNQKDIDSDDEKEILIGGSSRYKKAKLEVRELDGDLDFESNKKSDLVSGIFYKDKIIETTHEEIILRSGKGTLLWSKDIDDFNRPIVAEDYIIYSKDGELIFLNGQGEKLRSAETGDLENLYYIKDHSLVAGSRGSEIVFTDIDSGEVSRVNVNDTVHRLDSTDFDEDGKDELVVQKQSSIEVHELSNGKPVDEDSVIYGTSKEVLKANSLNMTVFPGDQPAVPESIENATKARNADFSNLSEGKKKYYTNSREKMVYLAPIAARNNATITFSENMADRDFSNYSVRDLQNLFIEKFEPHHITVADIDSESGLLASHMATKQSSLPIQTEYNAVILEDKIKNTFDRIGENRKTVFQGKYISLLDAPAKQKSDPVEKGFFYDSEDGDTYRTDLEYGDLDNDTFMETGVGRYPAWPVILSTGGAGLRYGSSLESVFEKEGYDTTHLVEYRSDPVKFLTSLAPVEITAFLGEVEDMGDIVERFVSETAANALENFLIIVKALNYTEQLMEMYFEFQWSTLEFNSERGIDRMKELDIDPLSEEGAVQKSIMKLLYVFIWPDRHPNLNQTSLQNNIEDTDILYYQGIGDEDNWVLPEENKSSGRYSGGKTFEPEQIPRMQKTIIWDNSNLASKGEMKEKFLEKGASSYLGYSSVNYPAYSSITGYNFFLHRKTLGNSLKASVNQLKTTDLIYSPTTIHRSGIREKMESSLRLYGNPEMKKDPIQNKNFETERGCEENICKLEISFETPQKIVEHGDRKTVKSNASNYLLEPGVSITPLYSFSQRLPRGSSILNRNINLTTQDYENISTETYQPITSGGKTFNTSKRNIEIQKADLSMDNNQLNFVVSGFKTNDNLTEVVESANAEIKYRTPVNIKPDLNNRTLEAKIFSQKSLDGDIIYRIDNRTGSRDVRIEEGSNSIEIENLSYGEKDVELILVEDNILAQTRETVRVGKPLKISFFSPELRKGSTREVTAIIENPNSFTTNTSLRLRTGQGTELGMLENQTRSVSIPAGEEKTLNWRVLGTETGNQTVKLNNEKHNIKVRNSMNSTRSISIGNFFRTFSSPTSDIEIGMEERETSIEWNTVNGRVKIERSIESSNSLLETKEFKVSRTQQPGFITEKLETSKGSFIRRTEKGLTRESGNLEESELENKLELLNKETGKLERFLEKELNQP